MLIRNQHQPDKMNLSDTHMLLGSSDEKLFGFLMIKS